MKKKWRLIYSNEIPGDNNIPFYFHWRPIVIEKMNPKQKDMWMWTRKCFENCWWNWYRRVLSVNLCRPLMRIIAMQTFKCCQGVCEYPYPGFMCSGRAPDYKKYYIYIHKKMGCPHYQTAMTLEFVYWKRIGYETKPHEPKQYKISRRLRKTQEKHEQPWDHGNIDMTLSNQCVSTSVSVASQRRTGMSKAFILFGLMMLSPLGHWFCFV